jgi:hypothetical protein
LGFSIDEKSKSAAPSFQITDGRAGRLRAAVSRKKTYEEKLNLAALGSDPQFVILKLCGT